MGDNLNLEVPRPAWEIHTAVVDADYGEVVTDENGDPVRDDAGEFVREAEKVDYGRVLQYALEDYLDFGRDDDLVETTVRADLLLANDPEEIPDRLADQPRTRVYNRVNSRVKSALSSTASRLDVDTGILVGHALLEYHDGGTVARLAQALEETDGYLPPLPEEISEDDEAVEAEDLPTRKPEKVRELCRRVGNGEVQFRTEDLVPHIDLICSHDGTASRATREKYVDLVTDRLDVVRLPTADAEVWIPLETAHEWKDEGQPLVCYRHPDYLTAGERVERIRLEVARRAFRHDSGRTVVTLSTVENAILEGAVSRKQAQADLETAGEKHGFKAVSRGSEPCLAVDLEDLGADDWTFFKTAQEYHDGQKDVVDQPKLADYTESDETPVEDRVAAGAGTAAEAPATDGGVATDDEIRRPSNVERDGVQLAGGDPEEASHVQAYRDGGVDAVEEILEGARDPPDVEFVDDEGGEE